MSHVTKALMAAAAAGQGGGSWADWDGTNDGAEDSLAADVSNAVHRMGACLNTDKTYAVVAWYDSVDNGVQVAHVDIDNVTVTIGSQLEIFNDTGNCSSISIGCAEDGEFLVCYQDLTDDDLSAKRVVWNGSTFSSFAASDIYTGSYGNSIATAMARNADGRLTVGGASANENNWIARLCTLSGTTWSTTVDTETYIASGIENNCGDVCPLGGESSLVVYGVVSQSNYNWGINRVVNDAVSTSTYSGAGTWLQLTANRAEAAANEPCRVDSWSADRIACVRGVAANGSSYGALDISYCSDSSGTFTEQDTDTTLGTNINAYQAIDVVWLDGDHFMISTNGPTAGTGEIETLIYSVTDTDITLEVTDSNTTVSKGLNTPIHLFRIDEDRVLRIWAGGSLDLYAQVLSK